MEVEDLRLEEAPVSVDSPVYPDNVEPDPDADEVPVDALFLESYEFAVPESLTKESRLLKTGRGGDGLSCSWFTMCAYSGENCDISCALR